MKQLNAVVLSYIKPVPLFINDANIRPVAAHDGVCHQCSLMEPTSTRMKKIKALFGHNVPVMWNLSYLMDRKQDLAVVLHLFVMKFTVRTSV